MYEEEDSVSGVDPEEDVLSKEIQTDTEEDVGEETPDLLDVKEESDFEKELNFDRD